MNKKKMGLGRGLGALLKDKQDDVSNFVKEEESTDILIENIDVNPYQPRNSFDSELLHELKESIQVQGIIQPITIRKIGDNQYQLISGERRLKASKLAGLSKIPAFVKEADDIQMLEMGLIENIQRENLNPVEVAHAYQRLMKECKLTFEQLGERVGKERSTVNNYLRLLNLPEIILDGLKEKKLSMGHARALLGVEDPKVLIKLFNEIISKGLSVRRVEQEIKLIQSNGSLKKSISTEKKKKIVLESIQERLFDIFEQKVAVIADEKSKGEIKISYNNRVELENILLKLKK